MMGFVVGTKTTGRIEIAHLDTGDIPDVRAPAGMRTFVIVWIGQVISIVGSSLAVFGLGVWSFDRTGDAIPFLLAAVSSAFGAFQRPTYMVIGICSLVGGLFTSTWGGPQKTSCGRS
jgi:hypothetical protein